MDREYIILNEIYKDEYITQRELSKRAGLSLGSVNLLLKKMAKDGLIKIKQIPANRIAYMLTPKGLSEKLSKTYHYIQYYYNYFIQMKSKISKCLLEAFEGCPFVQVIIPNDELGELIRISIAELELKSESIITDINRMCMKYPVIVSEINQYTELEKQGFQLISILEKL